MVMRYRLKVFFDDALSLAHGLKCQFLIGHACLLPQNRPYEFKSLIESKRFDGKTHGRPALDRLPRLSANATRHRGPRQDGADATNRSHPAHLDCYKKLALSSTQRY